jgi:hypothetical protein
MAEQSNEIKEILLKLVRIPHLSPSMEPRCFHVQSLFFLINVGIRTSFRAPRLIPRVLKLTIM